MAKPVFLLLWAFIIFASAHDGYLLVANRQSMWVAELNPSAMWLIRLNNGDIWLLIAAKSVGTLLAAALLLLLYWSRPRLGLIACAGVAIFQLGLLLFLYQP